MKYENIREYVKTSYTEDHDDDEDADDDDDGRHYHERKQ